MKLKIWANGLVTFLLLIDSSLTAQTQGWQSTEFPIVGHGYFSDCKITTDLINIDNCVTVLANTNGNGSDGCIDELFLNLSESNSTLPLILLTGNLWNHPIDHRLYENPNLPKTSTTKQWDRAVTRHIRTTNTEVQNHSNLYGWYIWDEPLTSYDFNRINNINNYIRSIRMDKLSYINLLPIYHSKFGSGIYSKSNTQSYKNYIDSYISTITVSDNINVLSVDYYPFFNRITHHTETYYHNLETLRDKSMQYNIPFWIWIQTAQDGKNRPIPTADQIRFQVYSALAYGAKGILYYALNGNFPNVSNTIFENDGNINFVSKYDMLVTLKNEILNIDTILLNLNPICVYHNDSTFISDIITQRGLQYNMLSDENRVYHLIAGIASINENSDSIFAMVGYFKTKYNVNERTDDYMLIVNKDFKNQRSFKVRLNNNATIKEVSKITGQLVTIKNISNEFNIIDLMPGEGKLFKIEDNIEEYIQNINEIIQSREDRIYIAHDEGVIMIDKKTGGRRYFDDWKAFTPAVDIELDEKLGRVYICHDNGKNGNFIATDLDLKYIDGSLSNDEGKNTRVTSVAFSEDQNEIYILLKTSNKSSKIVLNRNNFSLISRD
jgi:hypothetical protein